MEAIMRARLLIAAFAGLSFAAAASAEPVKAPVRNANQHAEQGVNVVVAAADDIRTPATAEHKADAPAKRERKARVTTCRCGDQTPNE